MRYQGRGSLGYARRWSFQLVTGVYTSCCVEKKEGKTEQRAIGRIQIRLRRRVREFVFLYIC